MARRATGNGAAAGRKAAVEPAEAGSGAVAAAPATPPPPDGAPRHRQLLLNADVLAGLRTLEDDSVDLVVTSPPYADARRKHYGGPPPDEYVEWYRPIAQELKRVLVPEGSYVLNIKEKVVDGERSEYVYDLVRMHRRAGWRWHESFIWAKTAAVPGAYGGRLRDAWEHCYQFCRSPKPRLYRDEVRQPAAPSTTKRILAGQAGQEAHHRNETESGFGVTWGTCDPYTASPDNVLRMSPLRHNVGHPAPYPVDLPLFFVKLLCPRGGLVLDPFLGSGSTAIAAERHGCRWAGIERSAKYCAVVADRVVADRQRRAGREASLQQGRLPQTGQATLLGEPPIVPRVIAP